MDRHTYLIYNITLSGKWYSVAHIFVCKKNISSAKNDEYGIGWISRSPLYTFHSNQYTHSCVLIFVKLNRWNGVILDSPWRVPDRLSVRPPVRLYTWFPELLEKNSIAFIPSICPYGVSLMAINYFRVPNASFGPLVAIYLKEKGISGIKNLLA